MLFTEQQLRLHVRKLISEFLGAKSKESILQRALGGTVYGGGDGGYGGDYYDDYDDYYSDYDDYDDGDDGDDGGDDGGDE